MNVENKEEIIQWCIESQLINVKELAAVTKFSQAYWYNKLKEHNITYKKDITDEIMFAKVKEEEHKRWVDSIKSCEEEVQELLDNNWVWYGDGNKVQLGESGVRRSVTTKYYKERPYLSYRAIPDTVEDDTIDQFKTCCEWKYVFVSPEGDRWHGDKMKSMCDRLNVDYQGARDCSSGKTSKLVSDWIVKKTINYYAQ